MATHYLACDLGAESGRLMLGTLADGKLTLEELHRFPNGPVRAGDTLHWNVQGLFNEVKTGLKKAAARKLPIAGISADSWGVDYLLLDDKGQIIEPTFHYRDSRTTQGVANAKSKVSWETIYSETGIQFMALNTIYQLASETPERLQRAKQIVLMGDAFNHWFSGVAKDEVSLASTSQLYNPKTRTWSKVLLEKLGLRPGLFPEIVQSGTVLGPMRPELAKETGLTPMPVIASCSHDTGAAVAAVPAQGDNWAYLSSGTWSLMGVELPSPLINDECRELNFTNEIGYGNSVRLLKNIVGLWIVQECRRAWAMKGQEYDYGTLAKLAAEAKPFTALINPDDARFLSPNDMPEKIAAFCRETKQPVPETPGAMARCVLESLAMLYRRTLKQIEKLTGKRIERLHIVGGGSKNQLLSQFAANALQIPVLVGPVEATALGNIIIQALALGHFKTLAEARACVHKSSEMSRLEPQDKAIWDAAGERFDRLITG
jgi:rhamnulokinase